MIVNHSAGLAEFSGGYFSKWVKQFKKDILIIKSELKANGYCLQSLENFENIIYSIWEDEERIVNCYSDFFKIELIGKEDRKKLQKRLKMYLFRKGTKNYPEFPQTILTIAHNSANKFNEIQAIVPVLQNDIVSLMHV
jgi:septation ring formation regulator EzrA